MKVFNNKAIFLEKIECNVSDQKQNVLVDPCFRVKQFNDT